MTTAPKDPDRPSEVHVVLPARTVFSLILAGVGLVIAINLINAIQGVLIWTLAAIFLALAAEAPIRFAERHGRSRRTAAVSVYFGALTVVFGILAAILVPLAAQTTSLVDDLPRIADRLRASSAIRDLDQRFHVLNGLDNLQARAPDAAGLLFGLTGTVFGLVLGAVSVFFLALFTSMELPRITRGVLSLLPPERAELVDTRIDDVNRVVARYVGANLAISAIAVVVHLIALELLGVPFAFVLAILVGLFDLVPLVGATIAGLLVVGVSFTQGVEVGVAALVLVIVYQQLENHVLQPVIMGKGVDISPVAVIFSILVGSALLGVLGALLAIPAAASLQLVLGDVLWRRRYAMAHARREAEEEPAEPVPVMSSTPV